MTQYARPDEDDGIGSWDNADEDQTDLFGFVNGTTAGGGAGGAYIYLDMSTYDYTAIRFKLDSISDPETSVDASHKVYYRCKADGGGPGMPGATVQAKLYAGTSLVATDPTAHETPDDDSYETFYWPLTPSQANAIGSDYSDLRISLTPADPEGLEGNLTCNWVYFECPDAPAAAAAANGKAFMLFLDT